MNATVRELSRDEELAIKRCIDDLTPRNASHPRNTIADMRRLVVEHLDGGGLCISEGDVGTVIDMMERAKALRIVGGRVHPPLDDMEED